MSEHNFTKHCFIWFSLWWEKVTLAIEEKHFSKTCSAQSIWIIFGNTFYWWYEWCLVICHSLLHPHLHKLIVSCTTCTNTSEMVCGVWIIFGLTDCKVRLMLTWAASGFSSGADLTLMHLCTVLNPVFLPSFCPALTHHCPRTLPG